MRRTIAGGAKGFTEWTNVTKAQAEFRRALSAASPADLGFYDLRVQKTREQQAALAACARHPRVLLLLLTGLQASACSSAGGGDEGVRAPDFPYCFCWANENWTRRWDGADHEILIAQAPRARRRAPSVRDLLCRTSGIRVISA
jgi:hypothetical protein